MRSQIPAAVGLGLVLLAGRVLAGDASLFVDFRYRPGWWATSICLPDDTQKTLVARSGELLYDYGGRFYPYAGGRGFRTTVGVVVTEDARPVRQELADPRIPIVRTIQQAPGLEIVQEAFATTVPARPGGVPNTPRMDMILVHVKNSGKTPRTIRPGVIVKSEHPLSVDLDAQRITVKEHDTLGVSRHFIAVRQPYPEKRIVSLAPLTLGPGEETHFSLVYAVNHGLRAEQTEVAQAMAARDLALAYWNKAPLPFGRVQVPDPQVQALVDSSIRNIWQARDIKQGVPVFQVGPTCYRGLWIVDGAFLLEAATALGAGQQARHGIQYTLKQQRDSGAFEVLSKTYYKENGIVLWTCVRHARLTQDKPWLKSIWPRLEKTVGYIQQLRRRSRENDDPLDDGLIPPGEIDGGLSGKGRAEFTNVYWNLAGLKAAIRAARWLDKTEQANQWQAIYDDFLATFRRAATRDQRQDVHGNTYLPILMGNRDHQLPQRAQWAFCHAVYPGQLFPANDPLVTGNLAMLAATEQEGMVVGTGWDAKGIWNYFASFYGHAWLWTGEGRKAAECLYAMANHASPLLAWREEQNTRDMAQHFVGDMPHNWASAEFIRLAIHLLALDRGDQLHLFEGLPREWTRPGMTTRLDHVATPFGPLTLSLRVASDGRAADLQVAPLKDPSCRIIVLHLGGWARTDKTLTRELDPSTAHKIRIPLDGMESVRRGVESTGSTRASA